MAEFNGYGNGTTSPDMVSIRAMRLLIQTQTFAVCKAGRYMVRADLDEDLGAELSEGVPPAQQPASGSRQPAAGSRRLEMVEVLLQPSERRRTVLHLPGSGVSTTSAGMPLTPRAHRTGGLVRGGATSCTVPVDVATSSPPLAAAGSIEVKSTDCLEEARALLTTCEPGERVAVLNMANAFTPGGGFRAGCGAQEENLHRRSDLHLFLEDERAWQPLDGMPERFYPIPEGAALYSRDVRVFRGPEAQGYPMLKHPFNIDVVSCPAIDRPTLSSATRLSPVAEDDLRIKIRSLLVACQEHGATHLVLSALGCGAFRNPPDHVADLFKEALLPFPLLDGATAGAGPTARYCFKRVVFSIFDDHNAGRAHNPEGNFVPFHRCFSANSMPVAPATAHVTSVCGGVGGSGGADTLVDDDDASTPADRDRR